MTMQNNPITSTQQLHNALLNLRQVVINSGWDSAEIVADFDAVLNKHFSGGAFSADSLQQDSTCVIDLALCIRTNTGTYLDYDRDHMIWTQRMLDVLETTAKLAVRALARFDVEFEFESKALDPFRYFNQKLRGTYAEEIRDVAYENAVKQSKQNAESSGKVARLIDDSPSP